MATFATPPPAEPEPDTLDEQVDWLTYSHHELYAMANEGLDLAGATDVSARWARLGEQLDELAGDLRSAVERVSGSWEGEAADQAAASVARLVDWTRETGIGATTVSGCVTREINNAVHTRSAMPEPPPTTTPQTLVGSHFTGAAALTSDSTAELAARRETHRQAAHVMEQFQSNSREVYGTVPQFASPVLRDRRNPPPVPPKQPPVPPRPPQPVPAPIPGRVPTGGGNAVRLAPGVPPAETPVTPRPAPAPNAPVAAPPEETGTQTRTVAAAQGRSSVGGSGGMMPGVGGAQGEKDHEHKRPDYLKEDDDLWGVGTTPVAPPVIGEGRDGA